MSKKPDWENPIKTHYKCHMCKKQTPNMYREVLPYGMIGFLCENCNKYRKGIMDDFNKRIKTLEVKDWQHDLSQPSIYEDVESITTNGVHINNDNTNQRR